MNRQRQGIAHWYRSGEPWVWMSAGAVSVSLIMVVGLSLLIAVRGLGHFWPAAVVESFYHQDGQQKQVIGEVVKSEFAPIQSDGTERRRYLVKTGNRDALGFDFRWVDEIALENAQYPPALVALERHEWGNFYGYLLAIKENATVVAEGDAAWPALEQRLARVHEIHEAIRNIEKGAIGAISYRLEQLRLKERRDEIDGSLSDQRKAELARERASLAREDEALRLQLSALYRDIGRDSLRASIMEGREVEIPLSKIVRAYRPNAMGVTSKIAFYFAKLWEFVSDEPREANTEGGIFPAIFGTVLMVLIMSVMVTPFGVIAAVYLREYAKQGPFTRAIRIAVNNLAGVPSIVYGVFGLGFFVYFLGGNIDRLFYPEALPAPTFGTPGILWASLTLAILTVPVVIVATEEGLARIPRAIREGSLALGATKFETLWRVVLPMASPAMITGLILAIARAAGEVAPLMLVGVVKLAPTMPLDGNFPFIHLERKFMHLGFHIYDVGFQSPNVEAARPLVYATALLLVIVIIVLNLAAIYIRNRLRAKYRGLEG